MSESLQGLQKLPQTETLVGATLSALLTAMKGFCFNLKNIILSTTAKLLLQAE